MATPAPNGARPPFSMDRPLHAAAAKLTAGVSPAALSQAYHRRRRPSGALLRDRAGALRARRRGARAAA